jgi:hypothetical protein
MQQQPIYSNAESLVVFTGCNTKTKGPDSVESPREVENSAASKFPLPSPLPPLDPATPFVSFVIVTRNDSPRLLQRMCRSLRALTADAARFALKFEIVIVDWNSIASQPSVADAMRSTCLLFLPVRVIIVPPHLHASQPNSSSLEMLLNTAKNVGARRVRGQFIVFTNADDIFPPKLLLQLSPATLQRGRVYRAMRWEVHAATEADASVDYSAFFSDWGNSNARGVFATQTEQSMVGLVKFRSDGLIFEVNPKRLCAVKIFHAGPHARESSNSLCPSLEGAAALCDSGVDPISLDNESQQLLTDASGDFIAVAAEDFRMQRGAIQLPAMRHEDSLMLCTPVTVPSSTVFMLFVCDTLFMYTLARGGLRQRVFAGECSVMHQWHPALASSQQRNWLEFVNSMHLTASDSSPFFWNGSLVDVDLHLRGAAGGDTSDERDDWGLNAHELEENVVEANAR